MKGTDMAFDAINEQRDYIQRLRAQLHYARAWSAAWKRAAKEYRTKWLRADIGRLQYKLKNSMAENERDEALAELDAVRERNEALEAERRLLAAAVALLSLTEGVDAYEMGQGKVIELAESILEGDD